MNVNFDTTGPAGNLTVSLEAPDMQSQELGVALPGLLTFEVTGNFLPGAKAAGLWKLNFLASPEAVGWQAWLTTLVLVFDQCV